DPDRALLRAGVGGVDLLAGDRAGVVEAERRVVVGPLAAAGAGLARGRAVAIAFTALALALARAFTLALAGLALALAVHLREAIAAGLLDLGAHVVEAALHAAGALARLAAELLGHLAHLRARHAR